MEHRGILEGQQEEQQAQPLQIFICFKMSSFKSSASMDSTIFLGSKYRGQELKHKPQFMHSSIECFFILSFPGI